MEITPSPHRPAPTPWGRLLALVIVLGPVTILVLLPIGLGLERYVMSGDSMDAGDHGVAQGTVLFERAVPVGEVRVGDVITFHPPSSAGIDGMVTHRVVDVRGEDIITQGDAEARPDPWVLRGDPPTVSRLVFTLPFVGYAYLLVADPGIWAMVVLSAALLALLLSGEIRRRRQVLPTAEPVLVSESRDEE
jgi:signal peptidase I